MSRVLPILFNADMVRAVLDGRKTVTRRVIKLPKYIKAQDDGLYTLFADGTCYENQHMEELVDYLKPPYRTDDVLYVRETWAPIYPDKESNEVCGYIYKEDSLEEYDKRYPDGEDYQWGGKWHPSIHMPKEAARIWLKVKDIRVERLQEITAEDALSEGAERYIHLDGSLDESGIRTSFIGIWNSTIKKSDLDHYGWDANPWVWVIEFERIEVK